MGSAKAGQGQLAYADLPQKPLAEVFQDYDVINVDPEHGYIVAREKPSKIQLAAPAPSFAEIGATGQTSWGAYPRDEYNAKLRGIEGLRIFDQMRKSDGQVRQSLQLIKTPVIAGRWYMQPASTSQQDRNIADFVWRCFNEFMTISFKQVLKESLSALDFGHWVWEIVYEPRLVDGVPRIVWKKFAPRHPLDIYQWDYDNNGGPVGIRTYRYSGDGTASEVTIPIDKLVVITWDREGGNLQGTSILRGAYKHWYFVDNLYKIDAIQKERHGIGIPIIKLPPSFSTEDGRLANEIGRNLRVNEKAHVVLPPMFELEFAKLEGQPVDAIRSIEHHSKMILANVLGEFTQHTGGTSGGGGTAIFYELFLKSARFVGDVISDAFNQYAIRKLVDYNYSNVGYPQLMVRRIGETTDQRTMSFALRNYVGADIIRATQDLEDWTRQEMDLPPYDKATDRKLLDQAHADKQAALARTQALEVANVKGQSFDTGSTPAPGQSRNKGARAGLPRQTPPKARSGTGSNRVGGPSNNSAGKGR